MGAKVRTEDLSVYSNLDITVLGQYRGHKSPVLISCNTCSKEWEVLPIVVRKGPVCPFCTDRRWDTDKVKDYLDQSGKKITLLSEYVKSLVKLSVACQICNYQWQTTLGGLHAYGCPSCSGKVRGSKEKLQSLFNDHGHDVTVVGDYVNNSTPVETLCNGCDRHFYPVASSVMYGTGCPFCCFRGNTPKKPAQLYYLRIEHEGRTFWKVGITTKKDVMSRFTLKERRRITVLYSYLFEQGEDARLAEKNIINMFRKYCIEGIAVLDSGNTEIFTHDVLQMDHLGGNG